jgi:neutral ceramidase
LINATHAHSAPTTVTIHDNIGYIAGRRAFELGGYQVWTGLQSFLEPGTGEAIVAESIKLLDQLQ